MDREHWQTSSNTRGTASVQGRRHVHFYPPENSLNKPSSKEKDSLGTRISHQLDGGVLADEAKTEEEAQNMLPKGWEL